MVKLLFMLQILILLMTGIAELIQMHNHPITLLIFNNTKSQ